MSKKEFGQGIAIMPPESVDSVRYSSREDSMSVT